MGTKDFYIVEIINFFFVFIMKKLRNYLLNSRVYNFYKEQHEHQTFEFASNKTNEYYQCNKAVLSIGEVLEKMDTFIDPSDPDLDEPNSIHAYQTAERIRRKYPKNLELQLCGLIHDLGKILFAFDEPSWAIVGDTYVLGAEFPRSIVFPDTLRNNIDSKNSKYTSKYGIYKPHCGIENLTLTFGHDIYLYNVLSHFKNNTRHRISKRYLDIIRFHSFYPWHSGGSYKEFMNKRDYEILEDVLEFNTFDLYSKEDPTEITNEVKEYYARLINIYFPEKLYW